MLQFNVGAYLSFSGIVIPALTGVLNEHNRNETLKLTPIQTSWIGKPLNLIITVYHKGVEQQFLVIFVRFQAKHLKIVFAFNVNMFQPK